MDDSHEVRVVQQAWDFLEAAILGRLEAIAAEIRSYPPPIPACDAQFNHLVEQRETLGRELVRLRAAMRDSELTHEGVSAVERFVENSQIFDTSRLHEALPQIGN